MDKLKELLLNKIYSKQLPTTPGGGIHVPVVCPHYLRELFEYPGSPAPLLGAIVRERDFPFQVVRQAGVIPSQLWFPKGMDWTDFVGPLYGPRSVGGYAFIPKEIELTQELRMRSHRIAWWPKDLLVPYAHMYNKPEVEV